MCSPLNPLLCPSVIEHITSGAAQAAGTGALDLMLMALNDQLHAGIKTMAMLLAGWLVVPSTAICPGGQGPGTAWIDTCNAAPSAAAQLRSWMLPVTILVAMLGLLWQAITMTVTRKGEPMLQVIRGLATTALWGAVGIVGTQLAMRGSDAYTFWILKQAVFGDSANPMDTLGTAIADMSLAESYNALVALLLFYLPILFLTLAQIILMIFREGSVVILAGLLQLAAAGSFTKLTSGWLPKITGWMLALVCYKPVAASVYATAFALMGNDGMRNSLMGLAVMILALFAMPALMKFFNWTTGSLAQGSSAMGMLGSAAAAGVHAASSLRGIGGYRPSDHATYMDDHGPGTGPAGPGASSHGGGPSPSRPSPTGPTGTPPAAPTGPSGAGTSAASAAGSAGAGVATGGASVAAQVGVEAVGKVKQAAQQAAATSTDTMQSGRELEK